LSPLWLAKVVWSTVDTGSLVSDQMNWAPPLYPSPRSPSLALTVCVSGPLREGEPTESPERWFSPDR
jgi:hypothetical protein